MSITHPTSAHVGHPLEGGWVERPLILFVEGRTLTGTARANWGAVEVTITSPLSGVTRSRDGRGWAFAMMCHHRPDERFALDGGFTPRGLETARRMLADIYLDWLAVTGHEAEVDAAARRTRQELADLARQVEASRLPCLEERQALRRAFKAGELSQRDYQARRKEVGRALEQATFALYRAEHAAGVRFAVWIEGLCGRKMSLVEAERLLTEVAVIVEAPAAR
jgi:hypothetical protein